MMVQSLDIISVNIWQILISLINLLILFLMLKKFLFKPVQNMMAARQAQVDQVYEDADKRLQSANEMKQEYEQRLSAALGDGPHPGGALPAVGQPEDHVVPRMKPGGVGEGEQGAESPPAVGDQPTEDALGLRRGLQPFPEGPGGEGEGVDGGESLQSVGQR